MKSLFQKPFRFFLLLIILVELLSLLGFIIPFVNQLCFFILSIIIFVISLFHLEYGIFALLTELFIGSKGHLFFFDLGSIRISFRMALFAIVIFVWLIGLIKRKYKMNFLKSKFFIFYFLLFILLIWGVAAGFLYQNSKDLIFFDANAWLYLLLIFPFYDVLADDKIIEKILKIFTAAITWLAIKSFIIFFLFTHQVKAMMPDLYYWIRTRGLGEITAIDSSFYRVFFQSQIYSLIGFFIFLALIIFSKNLKKNFYFLFIPFLPILISFSRSYWLGFLLSVIIFLLFLKIKEKFSWQKIGEIFMVIIFIFIFSIGFILFSLKLPPKPSIDFGSLIEKRFTPEEPAASSRIAQLPYLLSAILEKPTLGSGFGKTVSYFSRDPRALERHPLGLYTTYAFEWGYLDTWLKIGLVGLFFFFLLLWKIFREGTKLIPNSQFPISNERLIPSSQFPISNEKLALIFGLIFGLIALMITHFTSPYLNHPLGLGYLILCSLIFEFYG